MTHKATGRITFIRVPGGGSMGALKMWLRVLIFRVRGIWRTVGFFGFGYSDARVLEPKDNAHVSPANACKLRV